MEPTAPNSANTDYEGLELVVEWLKAHSDSRNDVDRFEGTPMALNDTSGPDRAADWLQASSNGRNEDDELTNEISPNASTEVTITAPVVTRWVQVFFDSRNENDELANPVAVVVSPRQRRPSNTNLDQPSHTNLDHPSHTNLDHPSNTNLDPNVRFICTHEGCGQAFRKTTTLYRHESKHKPAAFHCEQCNYSTCRKDNLKSHHDRRHKHYTDLLKCQECNHFETYHKADLRKHQSRHVKGTMDTRQ